MRDYYKPLRYLILFFVGLVMPAVISGQAIPIERLTLSSPDGRLTLAKEYCEENHYREAMTEILRQIEKDPSLVAQAATILGGNYSLVRLTDNISADMAGNFSPSGKKLIYTRDTSIVHYDDGLFDWYEDRTTGIVVYDFETGEEFIPMIPQVNPHKPRFKDDSSFYYIAGAKATESSQSTRRLYLYDLELGQINECFDLASDEYYPVDSAIIVFDRRKQKFLRREIGSEKDKVLYDNDNILNLKRPLGLIQNVSVAGDALLFEAGGYGFSKHNRRIYSLPLAGGKPSTIMTESKETISDGEFNPAGFSATEYACLMGDDKDADVFYRHDDMIYRLTFDGGIKENLIISPDGLKLAYSLMVLKEGIESFEIMLLDFSREATTDDLKYRCKQHAKH